MNKIHRDLKKKDNFFGSNCQSELEMVHSSLRDNFESIKEQFEDHLVAINENTNEIQSNFEYMCELDKKIDKLNERIDLLTNLIKEQRGEKIPQKEFSIQPLTSKEKEIFHALYILTENRRYTTYKAVSRRARFSESLVASYITNLIEKGIPVMKKYANRAAYITLDPCFREVQAKENIVGVNTLLTHWVR